MRKRMIKISVRLNEQEHAHLKRLSETTGLKMEPLIRQLILGRDVKPRPPENLAELLRQISAMGNNINQIAKRANETGRVYDTDIQEIRASQKEIWKKIDELLTRLGALGL